VFVDEFVYINLKKIIVWSRKGTRTEVVQLTITILGAITPYNIVNIKVRKPMIPLKKSKWSQSKKNTRHNYWPLL
jgi:hypothetical protein